MAKRTAPQSASVGPAFPPLGLVAGPGAPGASGPASLSSNHLASSYSNSAGGASSSDASHANGLPPAPNKVDINQAQQCRLQDAYWSDEEEDMDCPLCLEEIDLSDANFKPCPCGYQICRFCWHHIKQNLNGRCPACRRKYSDQTVEFKPMTAEEIKKLTQAKKQKEREKKELEAMNRKHLANMRVVQKNLVYVVGLSSKLAKEELIPTLRSNDYFGQYGRISKILISKRTTASKLVMGTSESAIGVYVTYHRKEDAAKAIVAIDGSKGSDGRIIRASYGTTKYCTTYLRNLPCTNPGCTYLHEPGEEADSFTKEDLSTLRHAAKDTENKIKPASLGISSISKKLDSATSGHDSLEGSALPKTASWASGKPAAGGSSSAPLVAGSPFRESDMPPLSVSSASALARKSTPAKSSTPKPSKTTPATPTIKARLGTPTGRPESPAPPGLSRVSSSSGVEPSTPSKSSQPPGSDVVAAAAAAAATPTAADASAAATQVAPSGPPGLGRTAAPPPGLAPPQTPPPRSAKPESTTATGSTYQPSSSAQALLDDMLQRREAEPEMSKPSPFPDFDDALSSFQDGDFCFNFPVTQQQQLSAGDNDAGGAPRADLTAAFGAFSPFGAPPGVLAAHTGLVGAGTPPPGIMRTPNRSATASPAPLGYSGSFDPFAPGAGETIKEDSSSTDQISPFAAIEQMKRDLSGERNATGSDDQQEGSDAQKRASRFEFAKRKESDSLGAGIGAGSPLRAELLLNMRSNGYGGEQDPLGMGKDASSLLGNVFEHDNHQMNGMNGFMDGSGGAPPGFGLGREGAGMGVGVGGYPGMGLSRPPGINGPAGAFGNRFGTNTPPPGISAPASRQQQALLASLHQMGGSTASSNVDAAGMAHMTNGSGASFLAELQQQAAQRAQQQAQYAAGERTEPNPLLAQMLRRGGRDDLAFNDPAIMSMARAAAHHQQRYAASTFSPFDHHHHQQQQQQQGGFPPGFSEQQRYLHHQSQQQPQQHDHRSQYPAMS